MAEIRVNLAHWQVLPLFGAVIMGAVTVAVLLVTITPRVEAIETEQAIDKAARIEQHYRICDLEGEPARDCDPDWELTP